MTKLSFINKLKLFNGEMLDIRYLTGPCITVNLRTLYTENTGVTADTVNDLRSGIYPEKRRTIHQMLFFVNTKSSNMHIGSDANNKLQPMQRPRFVFIHTRFATESSLYFILIIIVNAALSCCSRHICRRRSTNLKASLSKIMLWFILLNVAHSLVFFTCLFWYLCFIFV